MILFSSALIAIILLIGYAILRRRSQLRANPHNLPFPPGPKPWPLIGNISEIASRNQAEAYQDLAKRYGDLVFLHVLGINILFVNSFRHASELFEKRSANYSDRGTTVMSNELMGWDFSFGHMRYGDRWKKHRRMFHHQFQQSVAPNYWSKQRREAHSLLRRLLHSPHELVGHLRQNAAAVIMGVTYGISISSTQDRYITIAEKALDGMAKAGSPGAFLVDLLPILKYVPEWTPGASFKRKAREWRDAVLQMKETPFAIVVNAMKTGNAVPSFTSNLLSDLDIKENVADDIETIKNCAGLAYAGVLVPRALYQHLRLSFLPSYPIRKFKSRRNESSIQWSVTVDFLNSATVHHFHTSTQFLKRFCDGTPWPHWVCLTWRPRMINITVISFQQGPLSSEILGGFCMTPIRTLTLTASIQIAS